MTSKGATIDVGAWLRGLGLGEYEATFRENAINEKELPVDPSIDIAPAAAGAMLRIRSAEVVAIMLRCGAFHSA